MFTSYLLTFFLKYATISIYRKEVKVTKYYKGYKVRLFPTKEQEELMWKHIHACRFIWNSMLDEIDTQFFLYGNHISWIDFAKYIVEAKENYYWLNEISFASLKLTCRELSERFKRFFNKKINHPKYKTKKKSPSSYLIRTENKRFYFENNHVKVEKIGHIRCKSKNMDYFIKNKSFYNGAISYNHGKWILSFSILCESQALELTDKSLGIDLGIKELATCSFGEKQIVFHNINKSRKVRQLERKLKHLQRNCSRKYLKCKRDENNNIIKSKNLIKEEDKVKELYYRLTNTRQDYIHKITHCLVNIKPRRVVMETLNIRFLIKNKNISKTILDCKWGEFIRQMKYKCESNSIEFIQVPMNYKSSRICSGCGYVKNDLRLKDRTYICPECGLVIDRDFNAARNLENYVLKQ